MISLRKKKYSKEFPDFDEREQYKDLILVKIKAKDVDRAIRKAASMIQEQINGQIPREFQSRIGYAGDECAGHAAIAWLYIGTDPKKQPYKDKHVCLRESIANWKADRKAEKAAKAKERKARNKRKASKPKSAEAKKGKLVRDKANPYSTHWLKIGTPLWAKIVKARAGGKCEKSGRTPKKLDAHHLITKGRHPTALDINNGIALCSQEHTLNPGAPHNIQDSWRFAKWLQEHEPERWQYIQDHEHDTEKNMGSRTNLKEAYEKLKEAAVIMGIES